MTHRAKAVLGGVVSAAVLLAVFWNIEWKELAARLADVSWGWLPACLAVFAVQYVLRALRWRYLLRGGGQVRFMDSLDASMLGNFASFVLPLRAGEFVRPFALSRWTALSFPACFVSVVIERFFDLSCVLFSFAIFVSAVPGIPALAYHGALSLGVLAVAILLFIVGGIVFPGKILALGEFFLRAAPQRVRAPIGKFLADFLHGCDVLKSPLTLAMVTLLTALVWASTYFCFYLFLGFCNLPLSGWTAVGIGVMAALAVAAPSAPGFLGVYEGGVAAAFLLFGLSQSSALAYALITHVLNYLVFCVYGVLVLVKKNMRLGEMAAMGESR